MDKTSIRTTVWDRLEETGAARFPFPVTGRIPNFAGASDAAEQLFTLDSWEAADTVKANPDYAQFDIRVGALEAGRDVYVAVPRLAEEACFRHLDPVTIDDPSDAATISGANEHGVPRLPDALPQIDLIVVGSVAVTTVGVRIGKGEGYSDLEYALLREFDLVDDGTSVVTTVHEQQVIEPSIDPSPHDVPVDWIVTPERTIDVTSDYPPPAGIDWSLLSPTDVEEKPALAALQS